MSDVLLKTHVMCDCYDYMRMSNCSYRYRWAVHRIIPNIQLIKSSNNNKLLFLYLIDTGIVDDHKN